MILKFRIQLLILFIYMERCRGTSMVYQTKKSLQSNAQCSLKQSMVSKLRPVGFSIGKSVRNIKLNERIHSIKDRCLEKSIRDDNTDNIDNKNYSLGDEDLQVSYMLSEETDDAEIQEKQWDGSFAYKSRFKGRAPVIFFKYPKCCHIPDSGDGRIMQIPKVDIGYRIYGSEYRCIINAFEYNGFKKSGFKDWDVFFDVRGSKVRKTFSTMVQGQKFNHFAGCWHLGRKDELYKGIQKLRKIFPSEYSYLPKTFIFPQDYERFQATRGLSDRNQFWIKKPVASACGRNIRLYSNTQKIIKRNNVLISEYISNPHLINNLKYDLRIYVLVTSYNPLRIYIFENGLVRFATEQYSIQGKRIKHKFAHLTNFSINKHSKNFVQNKNNQDQANSSKWSLNRLKSYYEQAGINSEQVFKQIEDIIIKTCISAEPSMLAPKYRSEDKRDCGFEIYGFDVLIDSRLKAWLLEVNVCPSLCSSSPFDKEVKHTLLVDTLNLIGIKVPERNKQSPNKGSPKRELKRFRFKNPHSILNLCYENCLQLLKPQDWLILFESEEEMDRIGHFHRVFPTKSNIGVYESFFQCPRYNNLILWRSMLSKRNFLERLRL